MFGVYVCELVYGKSNKEGNHKIWGKMLKGYTMSGVLMVGATWLLTFLFGLPIAWLLKKWIYIYIYVCVCVCVSLVTQLSVIIESVKSFICTNNRKYVVYLWYIFKYKTMSSHIGTCLPLLFNVLWFSSLLSLFLWTRIQSNSQVVRLASYDICISNL